MNKKYTLYKEDNITAMSKIAKKIRPNIIYIDPPYNTSNGSLLFKDSFKTSDWRKFMKERIKKLVEIIDENAIIYMSIGNWQLAEAQMLLDKYFGKENQVAIMPRLTKNVPKTTQLVSRINDWLLIYKKGEIKFKGVEYEPLGYKLKDSHFKERGYYQLRPLAYKDFNYAPTMDCPIKFKNKIYYPNDKASYIQRSLNKNSLTKDWCWLWSEKRIKWSIENDLIEEKNGKLYKKTYWNAKVIKNKSGDYEIKKIEKRKKAMNSDYFLDNKFARKTNLGEYKKWFTYPKSVEFLKTLIDQPKLKEKKVLDLFSGSGTMALACKDIDCTLIMCQIDEKINTKTGLSNDIKTIADLTEKILINEAKLSVRVY